MPKPTGFAALPRRPFCDGDNWRRMKVIHSIDVNTVIYREGLPICYKCKQFFDGHNNVIEPVRR